MTKSQYHEQLGSLVAAAQALLAEEKAFQTAVNEALELQYAKLCGIFDAHLAKAVEQAVTL